MHHHKDEYKEVDKAIVIAKKSAMVAYDTALSARHIVCDVRDISIDESENGEGLGAMRPLIEKQCENVAIRLAFLDFEDEEEFGRDEEFFAALAAKEEDEEQDWKKPKEEQKQQRKKEEIRKMKTSFKLDASTGTKT